MKRTHYSFVLSAVIACSLNLANVNAAPVQFNQVVQIVNAKPGKAETVGFSRLKLAGDDLILSDDETKKAAAPAPQDDRVITQTTTEIVEDDVCDCVSPVVVGAGFPYGWLALGAVPAVFLVPPGDDETPPNDTPPTTPTPTPELPPTTPTPTPTPEPMTILLFGTGLAGIGFAARRKFGKAAE